MTDARRFRKNGRAAVRRIADETLLVPVCGRPSQMKNVYILNELAEFIWRRLDEEPTLDELVASVVDRFEVDRKRARRDAAEFVGRLLENDLIQERP